MLRLFDSRTGQARAVTPARPGQLATCLVCPAGPAAARAVPAGVKPGDVRAALVADLIRRVAERHHLVVTAWQRAPGAAAPRAAAPGAADPGVTDLRAADLAATGAAAQDLAGRGGPGDPTVAFGRACGALNIHPAQLSAVPPDPLDVQVAGEPPATGTLWLRPAAVDGDGLADGGAWPADLAERGLDPLALRLVLLRRHHQQPAALSWDAARDADQALRRWRERAASWARSPSKPMCAQYVTDFTGAFDSDLDTPAALALLDALAGDEEIPPGSKFEAFAYFDQLLGLDLARDVGR